MPLLSDDQQGRAADDVFVLTHILRCFPPGSLLPVRPAPTLKAWVDASYLASPADAIPVNQAGSPGRKVPTERLGIPRKSKHLMPSART